MNNTDYSMSRFLQISMEYLNLDEEQYAEHLDISVKTLNDIFLKKQVPNKDIIKKTCSLIGIPVWVCYAITINPDKKRFHDGARIAAIESFNRINELFYNIDISKTAMSVLYCLLSINEKFKSRNNDLNFNFE
jgi:hypothetical protein